MNEQDKAAIDKLLNGPEFRTIVESDIGRVKNVRVEWGRNRVLFYGAKLTKEIKIDETLATLRNKIN